MRHYWKSTRCFPPEVVWRPLGWQYLHLHVQVRVTTVSRVFFRQGERLC